MTKERNFSPGVKRRPTQMKLRNRAKQESDPWVEGTIKGLRQGNGFLVVVNNPSSSDNDRMWLDDQLAEIAFIQSRINTEMSSGKEISALKDLVGYPPYTFSQVGSFYRGAVVSLAQSWEEDGMQTLINLPVLPPESDDERRQAVLYGVGTSDDLGALEHAFLRYYRPSNYAKCFSESVSDKGNFTHAAKFFVQWELFQDEAADGLGISEDSPQFGLIMDQLEIQSNILREGSGKNPDNNRYGDLTPSRHTR